MDYQQGIRSGRGGQASPRNFQSSFQLGAQSIITLGNKRNCLLVKDDVGRGKPATTRLPGKDFAFGK